LLPLFAAPVLGTAAQIVALRFLVFLFVGGDRAGVRRSRSRRPSGVGDD
jgi:hypothetical protein